jgi:hypothetical protein
LLLEAITGRDPVDYSRSATEVCHCHWFTLEIIISLIYLYCIDVYSYSYFLSLLPF